MRPNSGPFARRATVFALAGCLILVACAATSPSADDVKTTDLSCDYTKHVRPLLTRYCLTCHSTKKQKGDLDLERFTSVGEARKDVRTWQHVLEMLQTGEMPPKKSPQP